MEFADILDTEVVRLEDECLDAGDLILVGLATGVWQSFERDVTQGLGHELAGETADPDEVSARATRFRRERRLLAATEFTSWLSARSLTLDDLSGVLGRTLLRESSPGRSPGVPVPAEKLGTVLYAEAVCSGVLDGLAAAGVERLAAVHRLGGLAQVSAGSSAQPHDLVQEALAHPATGLPALGESVLRRRAERILRFEAALALTRAELQQDERSLQRRLGAHALDWMRLTGRELVLGFAGAAHESRLLISEDGFSLEDVAELAKTRVQDSTFRLEQVPAAMRGQLASLGVGEVALPWESSGKWHVFELEEKVVPSLGDAVLRERVVDEAMADVLRRHAAGRAERTHGL